MTGPIAGLALCAALALACAAVPPAPLSNTRGSPEALAEAVLSGYERRDRLVLRALALTEEEFRAHVWPELPAARPERNLPFSYVWGDLRQKSEQSLTDLAARHGGRALTLVRVEFTGGTTSYGGVRVHRDTVLVVRDSAGAEHALRLYGSTIERAGAFKVFSYLVDD